MPRTASSPAKAIAPSVACPSLSRRFAAAYEEACRQLDSRLKHTMNLFQRRLERAVDNGAIAQHRQLSLAGKVSSDCKRTSDVRVKRPLCDAGLMHIKVGAGAEPTSVCQTINWVDLMLL